MTTYPTTAQLAAMRQAIARDWHADAVRHTGDAGAVRAFVEHAMSPRDGAATWELLTGIGPRSATTAPEPAGDDRPSDAQPYTWQGRKRLQASPGAWWAWLTRAAREDRARAFEARRTALAAYGIWHPTASATFAYERRRGIPSQP
jgi:hypothetical protein